MTTEQQVLLDAMEVLEGWPELWRHRELFRHQVAAEPAVLPAGTTLTGLALRALASPVAARDVFRAYLRSGEFAAARALLTTASFLRELAAPGTDSQDGRDPVQLSRELQAAVTAEKRRLHVLAEGLRLRALRTGQLDTPMERQLRQAVSCAADSRQQSESVLREQERKLAPLGWGSLSAAPVPKRWPFTDAAARVCGWLLGEEAGPRDAADWAPAASDAEAQHFLKVLRKCSVPASRVDAAAVASLVEAIERLLGLPKQPQAVAEQIEEGIFLTTIRGLDSPWLPELGTAVFPNGVPILIACDDRALPAPELIPATLFLSFAFGDVETAQRPERSLQISPATFFALLKDRPYRLERFLAELGTQMPRTLVHPDHPSAEESEDQGRRTAPASREYFRMRLAALGIHDLQPNAEVLDRLVFYSGGLVQLESRLIWEIVQRQRILRRKRQARLDIDGVHAAYECLRFQEFALGLLLKPLDAFPAERLVLGSLCEALGIDLLLYPVPPSALKEWLHMTERPIPESSLMQALSALIGRGLIEEVSSPMNIEIKGPGVKLPSTGVGHLIVRELTAPERVLSYIDNAYQDMKR